MTKPPELSPEQLIACTEAYRVGLKSNDLREAHRLGYAQGLAAGQQGKGERVIVAKEHVLEMGDGERPMLSYILVHGACCFASHDEASEYLKGFPIGWVRMNESQLLGQVAPPPPAPLAEARVIELAKIALQTCIILEGEQLFNVPKVCDALEAIIARELKGST